jgi:hypothetical protein
MRKKGESGVGEESSSGSSSQLLSTSYSRLPIPCFLFFILHSAFYILHSLAIEVMKVETQGYYRR